MDETRLKPDSNEQEMRRRYVELLRDDVDDRQQMDELRLLAFKLDKTAADVTKDAQTLGRVKSLRAAMKAGRKVEPQLVKVSEQIEAHRGETAKLMQARQRELDVIAAEHQRLTDLQNAARDAVREINELRRDGETSALLADEAEAKLSELD